MVVKIHFVEKMGGSTMYFGMWVTTFWRNIPHHLHLHFHLEDGSSIFLVNFNLV